MSDNIKDNLLDLHPDDAMNTKDSDQNCTLLIEEGDIQEEIDHRHGISQSESDLHTVSQLVHTVNCSSLDEIPVRSWNVDNNQEKESNHEAKVLD